MARDTDHDTGLADYLLATDVVVELATVASYACRTSGNGRSLGRRVVALVALVALVACQMEQI